MGYTEGMKARVLLLDDDPAFGARLGALLEARDIVLVTADGPADAAFLADAEKLGFFVVGGPFDAARRDLVAELARGHADVPLALLIAADGEDEAACALARAFRVNLLLRRPVLAEELAHRIARVLVLSGGEDPSADPGLEGTEPDTREIAELRKSYAGKIPELFAEVARQLLAAQATADADALQEGRRIAHALTGTAGSLGLTLPSAVAASMEQALRELLAVREIGSHAASQDARRDRPAAEASLEPGAERPADPEHSITTQILLVDDDPESLASIVEMGRENLIHVHTATSGAGALAVAAAKPIEAAIIEVYLASGENPFEIAQKLRSMAGLEDLPLAFLSADSSIPTRIAAAHAGASQFLDKPVTASAFAAAVRHLTPLETARRPRVLVVDDDPDFLRLIKAFLSGEGMLVETLSDPTRVLDIMHVARPDVILVDVVMPEISGFDVCRVLRSTEQWRELPVLFLTVHSSKSVLRRCYEAGGDDYIEKPVLKQELLARIGVRLDRLRLFRERADRDGLTGLPTRRAFVEQLRIRLSEAGRHKKPLSLCLIDLDHFKQVNDTHGHLAGDRVLAAFGRLLGTRFRSMDIRGRWGGEEFVVGFFGEEPDTARMIIGRVQEEFAAMTFTGDRAEPFQLTFSAGISCCPRDGRTFEELFPVADGKLYESKHRGRNRIES